MNLKNVLLGRGRGCCPTGRLVLVAKASGFSSVSEMLLLKNSEEGGEDASASSEPDASKEVA